MSTGIADRRARELLVNLTQREIKGKFKRTALGNMWSLINPIATMAIYTVVFGILMRVQIAPSRTGLHVFALWLMCGLVPWTMFAAGMSAGLGSIVGNANLVKKVYFPRDVLVGSAVLAQGVTSSIELGVLMLALLLFGNMVLPWLPLALVLLALLVAFTWGISLALATANVYFRDTAHFVALLLQIWMYATPIIYPATYVVQAQASIDAKLAGWGVSIPIVRLWDLNPLAHFVDAFRAMLYENIWPAMSDMLWATGSAAVSLAVGYYVFKRFEPRMAEEL